MNKTGLIVYCEGVRWNRPRLKRSGVSCFTIASRFMTGESVREIAADYNLMAEPEVEAAIRFEMTRRHKRLPETMTVDQMVKLGVLIEEVEP